MKRDPLTAYEQAIEDATDPRAIPATPPEVLAAARAAAQAALKKLRGGKRPGAGRPARAYVKTSLLLSPAARAKLEKLAKKSGSLSAAAEAAIAAM
jgi:hypothetical protein